MTIFLLVRHATCDPVGRSLAGRLPGIALNAEGRAQAAELATRLRDVPLDAIYSSPIQRARETADAIAAGRATPVHVADELTEIDVGAWAGRTFTQLGGDAAWRRFNAMRSLARASSGELMLEVQSRAVAFVERVRGERPEGRVALVSHADVIRGLVAHLAGIPLDLFQRLQIDPASVSVVEIGDAHVALRALNVTGRVPA
jgi:broad specificity phosphatase PhoE